MRRIAIVSSVSFVLAHVVAAAQNPPAPATVIQSEIARVRSQIQASGSDDQRAALLQRVDRADSALKAQHDIPRTLSAGSAIRRRRCVRLRDIGRCALAEPISSGSGQRSARQSRTARRRDLFPRVSMRWRKRPRIAGTRDVSGEPSVCRGFGNRRRALLSRRIICGDELCRVCPVGDMAGCGSAAAVPSYRLGDRRLRSRDDDDLRERWSAPTIQLTFAPARR